MQHCFTGRARPAVRLERQLADPPAVVWQALTDREQLRVWFPCDVIVAGGRWEVGLLRRLHPGTRPAGGTAAGVPGRKAYPIVTDLAAFAELVPLDHGLCV